MRKLHRVIFSGQQIVLYFFMKSVINNETKPKMTVFCSVSLGLLRVAVLLRWFAFHFFVQIRIFFAFHFSRRASHLPQNSERYKFTELLLVFCSSLPTFKYREGARADPTTVDATPTLYLRWKNVNLIFVSVLILFHYGHSYSSLRTYHWL